MPTIQVLDQPNSKPFVKGGPNPHRVNGRGHPRAFKTEEELEVFAQAVAGGLTIAQMATTFNISDKTVKNYKKDPRVKSMALKHIEDRILQVTRKVDSVIEARLGNASDLTTKELLEIRKEYLGPTLRLQAETGRADAATVNEAAKAIESDPEFASKLAALIAGPPVADK